MAVSSLATHVCFIDHAYWLHVHSWSLAIYNQLTGLPFTPNLFAHVLINMQQYWILGDHRSSSIGKSFATTTMRTVTQYPLQIQELMLTKEV